MADSHAEVYLHFVWATKWREESIPADLEREMHRVIEGESLRRRCLVLAVGGTLNHVHLLVRFSRTITFARYMDQIKGVSSAFVNERLPKERDTTLPFRWQPGYGVFSVGRNQLDPVIAYIHNQKTHHAEGSVHTLWEPPDDAPLPARRVRLAEGSSDRPFRAGHNTEYRSPSKLI